MGGPALIAVVEDDKGVADAICSLVRSLGLNALSFASAEEFLAMADLACVSCVLTDLGLPGMSGIRLKQIIDQRRPALPIIMMTGLREPALLASAADAEPAALLQKPVDANELCDCILAAIDADGTKS